MIELTRKGFLGGLLATAGIATGGAPVVPQGKPKLVLGVFSDTHITTPESCEEVENALRYFKSRKVDAVLHAGDITDWGIKSGYRMMKETWDKVFGGTDVVPLFITGNHDYDGWGSPALGLEMRANGYSEFDNIKFNGGQEKVWKEVFGEDYAPIRVRTVKGYDFISAEWDAMKDFPAWMEKNGGKYEDGRLFFYFQHDYIHGCWGGENKVRPTKTVLDRFPNCIAFTGHLHTTFNNERAINQTGFTHIAIPSLSYNGAGGHRENGDTEWNGAGEDLRVMPTNPARFLQRGDQGFVVNVYEDRVAVERFDFDEMEHGAPDWVIPLPVKDGNKPYDWQTRVKTVPAPTFPTGATVRTFTRHWVNRSSRWAVSMVCTFPSAMPPEGYRIDIYRIRAVLADGTVAMEKNFVSPAHLKMAKYEPKTMKLWFDVRDLPQGVPYRLEVSAATSFHRYSAPIYTKEMRVEPGRDKSRIDRKTGERVG